MPDDKQAPNIADVKEDIIQKISFESATKLLGALFIRAEGSMGASEDLKKIKDILIS